MSPKTEEEAEPADAELGVTEHTYAGEKSFGSYAGVEKLRKDLIWSNVSMKILEKKGRDEVKLNILKDVWGKAESGKTTAIMGASGAGSKYIYGATDCQQDVGGCGDFMVDLISETSSCVSL
jgi:hypothetical protein